MNFLALIVMVGVVLAVVWLWMKLKSTALLVAGLGFMGIGVAILSQGAYGSEAGAIMEIEALLAMIAGMIGIGSSAIISEVGRTKKAVEKKED